MASEICFSSSHWISGQLKERLQNSQHGFAVFVYLQEGCSFLPLQPSARLANFLIAKESCLQLTKPLSGRRDRSFLRLSQQVELRQFTLQRGNERHMKVRAGIHIDRRRHLEEAFKRQRERELREAEAEVTCPVDCVRVVYTLAEFERELQDAETSGELVVVDFYNAACGACKYVLPQFVKMCKLGCGEECAVDGHQGAVRFIKHDVRDDYDDLTDIARLYKVKHVPMFTIFMDGCRVEQFATRDRRRLASTIGRLLQRYHEVTKHEGGVDSSLST